MGFLKSLFNGIVAGDIGEKHGFGTGVAYLEMASRLDAMDTCARSRTNFESEKQSVVSNIVEMYEEYKELFNKDFTDRMFSILSTFSSSTPSNCKSVVPLVESLINDMSFFINVDGILQELKDGLELNKNVVNIKRNKSIILKRIDDVVDSSTAGECKRKMINLIEDLKEYGITVKNEEEVINKIKTNWGKN